MRPRLAGPCISGLQLPRFKAWMRVVSHPAPIKEPDRENAVHPTKAIDGNGRLHTEDMIILDELGNGQVLGRIKYLISKNGREIRPVVDIE